MAVGAGVWTRHGTFRSRCLCVAREREAALSSGGQPMVERSASRECLHPTGRLPRLPDRLSVLLSAGAVLGKRRPKAIGHVAKVGSAVSCLHPRLLSESLSCSDRCGGWMWLVARFVALGWLTGVGSTLRSFPWFRPSKRFCLLLAHLVPSVRITEGRGTTGSHTTPGLDHRDCVSLLPESPLFCESS